MALALGALLLWTLTFWGSAAWVALAASLGLAAVALRRRRALVSLGSLAMGVALAVALVTGGRGPSAAVSARRAEAALQAAVTLAEAAVQDAARRSVEDGRAALEALVTLPADAGVVLFDGDRAIAWGGRLPVAADPLWERGGVAQAPFHTVGYAVAVRGGRRAVAMVTLDARPPAERTTRSLRAAVAAATGNDLAVTLRAESEAIGVAVPFGAATLRVAAPLQPEALRRAMREERARHWGLLALAVGVLTLLVAAWRAGVWGRLLALGAGLLALALAPLSALSNLSRLFDAATYFSPVAGPYSASVAELILTGALLCLGVLAARRARLAPRRRPAATAAGLALAIVTPYLLRDLSRGITMPPDGADSTLWLAWQLGLFLVAVTLLTAGVMVGRSTLPRGRGLPLWVAPLLALLAAAAAPVALTGAARWPTWYVAPWVVAVAALVFARRSRAVLLPGALVAACGAVVLTWGASVRERVELAAADVDGLGVVDEGSLALLSRFASALLGEGPPRDRAALLSRYARAELAAGGYPVALTQWDGDRAIAEVVLGADPRPAAVLPVVLAAELAGEPVLVALPADPVASLVLAVPYPGGEVTTAVVRARTRLPTATAAAPLLDGRPAPPPPPYELALRPEAPALDVARTPWERRGDHLHAEWSLPTGDGAAVRVHAKVGFDAIDALLPRGGLIVLLDLAVLALLWAVDVAGDGALARWRRRGRWRWRRSYRAQLTIALFAFFVVPAGAFAVWSSRRLQSDDRATRELLVREYLRRAVLVTGPAGPTVVGIPPDVPQFLYRSGRLAAASDPLHLTLAPLGRWLDPAVGRALGDGEDIIATRALLVGDRAVLFGFKPLGREAVVAVPALVGDAALDQRRRDLGVLVLLTTLLGALAALALSGVAARRLARPIGSLRDAALALAGGTRAGLVLPDATVEFAPVFRAFDTMARDLREREAQLARVQRVFAWSEMARQVAHEIKNPLTPMRLGVQHVVRAWRDGRPDFGTILETNATRVLDAIDHLDATARGFARFGAPAEARRDVGPCDLAVVLRDLAALLQLGGARGLVCALEGTDAAVPVAARPDELREVLLNLAENARAAGARRLTFAVAPASDDRVRLEVTDDGAGIEASVLPRVFEPHFSTRSSGSGLGLAISRRLVEEWGGSIDLRSTPGVGTAVTLLLRAGAPTPP